MTQEIPGRERASWGNIIFRAVIAGISESVSCGLRLECRGALKTAECRRTSG